MFTSVVDDRAYLAFPLPDDRLEVVAVDAGTGKQAWRSTTVGGHDSGGPVSGPCRGRCGPRRRGRRQHPPGRWSCSTAAAAGNAGSAVHGDDAVYFTDETPVLVDRAGSRLVGLRLSNGRQEWTQANPRDQYGDTRTMVRPVGTEQAAGGPALFDGTPRDPWPARATGWCRWVPTGRSGCSTWTAGRCCATATGVADLDDLVVAHEDRLTWRRTRDTSCSRTTWARFAEPMVLHSAGQQRRVRPGWWPAVSTGPACWRCRTATPTAPRWWRPPRARAASVGGAGRDGPGAGG